MASQRVIPGWSKNGHDRPIRLEEGVHGPQNRIRIVEMLERVDGNDDIGHFAGRLREVANSFETRALGLLPRGFQDILAKIQADHAAGPKTCHIDGFGALTTTEIDDRLAGQAFQEFLPEDDFNFRFPRRCRLRNRGRPGRFA